MIVFAHLLNDRSGSPRVLKQVIGGEAFSGEERRLFVGSSGEGVLEHTGVATRKYWYRRSRFRLVTLFNLLLSQLLLFLALLRDRAIAKDAIIYVNTLLPFGAALYGRLSGRRVVYHVHESAVAPAPLRWLLVGVAKATADRLLYVSYAHLALLPTAPDRSAVISNAVDPELVARAQRTRAAHRPARKFVVLMLAYARAYKGTGEFLALAGTLEARTDIAFRLVLSDADGPASLGKDIPSNVAILPPTDDPAALYAEASLVLNLTRTDLCVETFGLTLAEGMAFGLPSIAPPVGGPAEIVRDGREGYLIDSRETARLAEAVTRLADDAALWQQMSDAAIARSGNFTASRFDREIAAAVNATRPGMLSPRPAP